MLRLCDRFRCLPSALFDEDQQLLQLLEIEALATPERDDGFDEGVIDIPPRKGGDRG